MPVLKSPELLGQILSILGKLNLEQFIKDNYDTFQYTLEKQGYSPYVLKNADRRSYAFIVGYIIPFALYNLFPAGKVFQGTKLAVRIGEIVPDVPKLSKVLKFTCLRRKSLHFSIQAIDGCFHPDFEKAKSLSKINSVIGEYVAYPNKLGKIYPVINIEGFGTIGFPKKTLEKLNSGVSLEDLKISKTNRELYESLRKQYENTPSR